MSLRVWALKPVELKPLGREGLILLAARCALRVEPWAPPEAITPWNAGLAHCTKLAFASPIDPDGAAVLRRELSNLGARAATRLQVEDEPLGRCHNYALLTLAATVEMTGMSERPALVKRTIEAAKHAGAIPAVLAHAGRAPAGPEEDPVDVACLAFWDAVRADVRLIAGASDSLRTAADPLRALRDLGPYWIDRRPDWAAR